MQNIVKKRTISKTFKDDPRFGGFVGWPRITNLLDTLDLETLPIVLGLFTLGCRASELRQLSTQQIHLDYSSKQVEVRNMLVLKWRKRVGSRTFHLNKSELSFSLLEEYLETRPDREPAFPFSYNQIYYRVALIENTLRENKSSNWTYHKGEWWPHRFRAERACQLIRDYGFSSYALKKWFGWRTDSMPSFYGSLTNEDVARMMLKPEQTLEITPEKLDDMSDDQRQFIITLLRER